MLRFPTHMSVATAALRPVHAACRNGPSMVALHPDFLQQLKAAQAGTVGQIAQVCKVL